MGCRQITEGKAVVGFVCAATITESRLRVIPCPFCGVRRRMLIERWDYGGGSTCLTCGTQWRDGEMMRRSTAFGAQREIVARAKARLKIALDSQAGHVVGVYL